MAKKITLADIAKILKKDKTKGDTSYWGVVQSVNTTDGKVTSYNVSLGGDAGTVKCRKLAGAKVNDTVLVTLRSTGEAIVVGTKNGDTDASDAQTAADTAQDMAESAYDKAAEVENHFWFEGTGSDVGAHISTDATIGTDTLNTLINAGGMAVRKGTTILSKFTDSLIELGRNSASAVIKMCGGTFDMRVVNGSFRISTAYKGNISNPVPCLELKRTSSNTQIDIYNGYDVDTVTPTSKSCITVRDTPSTEETQYHFIDLYSAGSVEIRSSNNYLKVNGTCVYINDYTTTSGTYPAVLTYYNGGYALARDASSASSRKIKHDIKDVCNEDLDANRLYDLKVRQFKFNDGILDENDARKDADIIGLIAEEVAEIYPVAAEYIDGEPFNWNHRYMIPAMLKLIQEQHTEIESLKRRVERLEAK